MSPTTVVVAERDDGVVGEDDVQQKAKVKEVPVNVLQNQRKLRLAAVLLVGLDDRARGWR